MVLRENKPINKLNNIIMRRQLPKLVTNCIKRIKVFLLAVGVLVFEIPIYAQVSMTTSSTNYSQNFNTLNDNSSGSNITWTDNGTIAGWYTNQTTYRTWSTGQAAPDNRIWSCGDANGNGERALGSRMSSTTVRAWGVALKNETGETLPSITIGFDAELYSKGGTGNNFVVQYSTTSTNVGDAIASASWTEIASIPASNTASVTGLLYTLSGLNLANNATIYIRWISVYSGSSSNYTLWATDNFTANWEQSTLPLTLTSFKATTQTDGINLNWSTASESNTDKFIVERLAADGSALTVATIKAAGNSTKTLHYAAIDKSAISGKTNYYRLKMLDQDGSFTYSKVIDVKYGITATSLLSTYPNPVSNTLTINLGETSSDFSMLYVVNSKGVVVKKIDVPAKTSQLTLDVSALKTGMYMIEGKLNGKKISSKLFKH